MKLITKAQKTKMLKNGERRTDSKPVVKLFTPDANATWLLCELDPQDPDLAFGLCDLGHGHPELGSVRISELSTVRGRFGLPVERDRFFAADKPISEYAADARRVGNIHA